jgi:N-acetyl-anhydromuramyl-L-alanine amidase AmpD
MLMAQNRRFSCGIMLLFTQFKTHPMEAEQLNAIANALSDLTQRHLALRGYL